MSIGHYKTIPPDKRDELNKQLKKIGLGCVVYKIENRTATITGGDYADFCVARMTLRSLGWEVVRE